MNRVKNMKFLMSVFIVGMVLLPKFSLAQGIELTGAGATFPYPLYSKMFSEYYKAYGVKVNYQAIG